MTVAKEHERTGRMQDLTEYSRLFEASSRLESAATALDRLSSGNQLTPDEQSSMRWAGEFLGQVDWAAGNTGQSDASGSLTVQAATVRPTFYAALIGIERRLCDAGLKTENEVIEFLRKLYQFLTAGSKGKRTALTDDRLKLASIFLHELSEGLLVQLTHNGVPKQDELLSSSLG